MLPDGVSPELLDAVDASVLVLGLDLGVLHANAKARSLFGEPGGRSCHQLIRGRAESCRACPARDCMAARKPCRGVEIARAGADGQVELAVCASPLFDGDGRLAGAVLTGREDGREQSVLKRELQEREAFYRTLFDEVPCFVSVQDAQFNVVQENRRFREEFGTPGGGRCFELYKHRREPCLECPVAGTFKDGESHRSEEVVTSKDGTPRSTLVVTAPLRGGSGEVDFVMEMSTDITELKRLQTQLQSLGMLVGEISHDIKGLLTGLDGGIYMVDTAMAKGDGDRLAQGWEMVRRNVERIRSLVLNILYYAKDREPDYRLCSPIKLAEEALEPFEKRAREAGIRLEQELDPAAITLEADAKAVRALLTNMLDNALHACLSCSEKPERVVGLRVSEEGDGVRFEISDNGVGMDREARDKAFAPFYSSKGTDGTGLGLFIANRIAAQHGGSIALDSELGKGTTFRVEIPKRPLSRKQGRLSKARSAEGPA